MDDLVTIQEAREHLRLDADSAGGADDAWLMIFIPAISQAVALWLKDSWRLYVQEVDSGGPVVDSAGDPVPAEPLVVKPVVKAAVLLEIASNYRFREGEGVDNFTPTGDLYSGRYGYILNKTSTALLHGLRRPTVA